MHLNEVKRNKKNNNPVFSRKEWLIEKTPEIPPDDMLNNDVESSPNNLMRQRRWVNSFASVSGFCVPNGLTKRSWITQTTHCTDLKPPCANARMAMKAQQGFAPYPSRSSYDLGTVVRQHNLEDRVLRRPLGSGSTYWVGCRGYGRTIGITV